jgi:hypothetical protein
MGKVERWAAVPIFSIPADNVDSLLPSLISGNIIFGVKIRGLMPISGHYSTHYSIISLSYLGPTPIATTVTIVTNSRQQYY